MALAHDLSSPDGAVAELRRHAAHGFVGLRVNPYLWPAEVRAAGGSWLAQDATANALWATAGELGMPIGVMGFAGLLPLLPSLEALMQVDLLRFF